jgi:hypothetical protein
MGSGISTPTANNIQTPYIQTLYIQPDLSVPVNPTQKCNQLSNDHVSYITKQYVTILKAVSILTDIVNGLKQNEQISDPTSYLIDNSRVLVDLSTITPIQSSLTIFSPTPKIVGVRDGRSIMKNYTVMDKYNDFFLTQYQILTDPERMNLSKQIISELNECADKALTILKGSCNDIGRVIIPLKDLYNSALANINNDIALQSIVAQVATTYPSNLEEFKSTVKQQYDLAHSSQNSGNISIPSPNYPITP